jgi:hypothetical protein
MEEERRQFDLVLRLTNELIGLAKSINYCDLFITGICYRLANWCMSKGRYAHALNNLKFVKHRVSKHDYYTVDSQSNIVSK